MTWLRDNMRVLVTVAIFVVTALVGVRAELKGMIDRKADREPILRELDQIQGKLDALDTKMDTLALRPAK
jgi:hypothetical protein